MSPVLSTFSGASARAFGFGYSLSFPSDFEHIETQTVGSTSVASVTFSSIPSGYKHLQVRSISRLSSGGVATMYVRFNSDSGNNYRQHYIYGDGSTVSSGASTATTFSLAGTSNGSTSTSNSFGASVIDILDYKDTSKYTTLRSISGADSNGSGFFQFFSSLWLSTAAVTSLTFVNSGAPNFVQHSTFSLYGIK